MHKNNLKLIITALIILIIITIGMYLLSFNKKELSNKKNTTEVTKINDNQDPIVRDIYHQFNQEEGILFNIMGSNTNKKYYAYLYQNDKTNYQKLDNIAKTYLTIQSVDYKNYPLDKTKNCYTVEKDDLKITYNKIFPTQKELAIETTNNQNPTIEMNENNICIKDQNKNEYTKTIDTMFVNAAYQNNKLIIYERVAFIKLKNDKVEFYNDYKMQHKVISFSTKEIDLSFINSANTISNALINNKDKFKIFTYTFEKNGEHYQFKSIKT